MKLTDFVNALPKGLVYAPIYRKGAPMESGKAATGKNPLEASFDHKMDPADVALAIKRLASSLASVAMALSSLTLTLDLTSLKINMGLHLLAPELHQLSTMLRSFCLPFQKNSGIR